MLRDHAAQQSYVFTGPVMIELEPADDLTTGRFRVRSQAISSVSTPSGDPSDTQVRRAAAMIEVNGKRHPLLPPGIVIGRGNDADLRITDPGVSRRHAEIRVDDNGGDPHVSVHDLGSTNGISVNGRQDRGGGPRRWRDDPDRQHHLDPAPGRDRRIRPGCRWCLS